MSFKGELRLDGKFDGEILESGTLIVGEPALVKGKIEVNAIVIHGFVEGEISIKERADIHSTGKLYGNLIVPIITINEGGIFEGHCKMGRDTGQGRQSSSPPQGGSSFNRLRVLG